MQYRKCVFVLVFLRYLCERGSFELYFHNSLSVNVYEQ